MSSKNDYRSKFESKVAKELKELGVPIKYEKKSIKFTQPAIERTYTPDFLLPNGAFIEVKGRFTVEDRKKHLYIRQSCPDIKIYLLFMNSNVKLSKRSKTTYGEWCDKHGIEWSNGVVKKDWLI